MPKNLLKPSQLKNDQKKAISRLYEYDQTILYAKMGAGKTIIALSAIADLLRDRVLTRVLVLAPKRVCNEVWASEYKRWEHTRDLKISLATGTESQRLNAIAECSDICVVNIENAAWFFNTFKKTHDFDGLVIDELSKCKNPGSNIVRSMRHRIKQFIWRVGMTGTPVSENFESLYSQAMLIDDGEALGKNKQLFLQTYFIPLDYNQYNWTLKPHADKQILNRLNGLIYHVEDYRDTLPEINYYQLTVKLPNKARRIYDKMKKDYIAQLDDETVIAANSAVQTGKLAQIASGFLYEGDKGKTLCTYTDRLYAVEKLVHKLITKKRTVIIVYWFDEDRQRLKDCFNAPCLGSGVSPLQTKKTVYAWNKRKLPVLLLHPRSAGHGLNLQAGGADIIWYTPVWSRDLFEQTNARLHRTGQTKPVSVYQVIAKDTIDEIIEQRVEDKALFDELLTAHLNAV